MIVGRVVDSKFTEELLCLHSGSVVFSGKETIDDDQRR